MTEPTNRQIITAIHKLERKFMTAVEDLQTAVAGLEADEAAAATEFGVLAAEIAELKAGTISEAQVEELAQKAAAVGAALKAATPEGKV